MNKADPCIQRCLKNEQTCLNLSHLDLHVLILSEIEAMSLGHVTKLHLNDNNLRTLPEEIRYIQNIQEISLDNNQLCDFPKPLTYLKQITSLTLSNNQLREFPLEILELPLLECLWMNDSDITNIPPCRPVPYGEENEDEGEGDWVETLQQGLSCLTRLKRLSLANNKIRRIPRDLCSILSLRWLALQGNEIRRLPEEMGYMLNLEHLHLCDNEIESVPDSLCRLPSLRSLYLKNNLITGALPEALNERLGDVDSGDEKEDGCDTEEGDSDRNSKKKTKCEAQESVRSGGKLNRISIVCLASKCVTEEEKIKMEEESAHM
eukprot:Nk52_evm7s276 gene=Nk52_evmTU7s276